MACRGPFQLLLCSSFLNTLTVEINFDAIGSFFSFLDTMGFPSKIHLIPKIPLLIPSLVETCFKSTIQRSLRFLPSCVEATASKNRGISSRSARSMKVSKSMEVGRGEGEVERTGVELGLPKFGSVRFFQYFSEPRTGL
jgi:hypothetical protein